MNTIKGFGKKWLQQPPASGQKPKRAIGEGEIAGSLKALIEFHHHFDKIFIREEQSEWSLFYLCGQLANLERKTIEPMVLALIGADGHAVRALQHFIGIGSWSAQAAIRVCQKLVSAWLGDAEGAVIVDGSGFPKQGTDSVGVAHQYCGALGKLANCQEGVFASYVSRHGYTFLDARLYMPKEWFASDHAELRAKCGVPSKLVFRTEPELAFEMVKGIDKRGEIPFRWVLGDERFGQNTVFLDALHALDKWYLVEVPANTPVWRRTPSIEPPGLGPFGRSRKWARLSPTAPASTQIQHLADNLTWTRCVIHEGSKGPLVAEFAFARMTNARQGLPGQRLWAMFRRHPIKITEVKFYLSNAPFTCPKHVLIELSGLRWPIETTFQEGKSEVGLDHYETRSWRGWHHHVAQTFMAHLFLIYLRLDLKKNSRSHHTAGAPSDCKGNRSICAALRHH